MKLAKKVLAIAIAAGMIFCLSAMAFAANGFDVVVGEVKDGVVSVDFVITNAEGFQATQEPVTYDAAVLSVKGAVKDGAYKAQYEACGESVVTAYNKNTAGTIIPGITLANYIFDDATFATMCEDNEVEDTPVTTANLVLFTVKFNVVDTEAASTEITWAGKTATVTLKAAPETTTAAPETTTAAPESTTAAPETTTEKVEEKTTIADEETTKVADETTTVKAEEPATKGNEAAGTVETGDTAVVAVAAGVCALAAAAFVVTKKRK